MSRIIVSLLLLGGAVQGFVSPRQQQQYLPMSVLKAAKGFGAKETPPPKNKRSTPSPFTSDDEDSTFGPDDSNPFPERQESDISQGKSALEKLRRGRAEQRNEELRKVKQVQETDALLREQPEAAVIPEKVAQRMGGRMLPFVGVPLFGAMGTFVGFWYMATYRDVEFEPALVAATTIVLLVVGLVGITYSLMSASWDPDREGSVLGFDEFSRNIQNIKTGLSRSQENIRLRDKMSEYSPEEIANVDAPTTAEKRQKQSFGDKIGDNLE